MSNALFQHTLPPPLPLSLTFDLVSQTKDILDHYRDFITLANVDVLIIDECHHAAAGNHSYGMILKKHYHSLPVNLVRVLLKSESEIDSLKYFVF
jgi:hypothetical protein